MHESYDSLHCIAVYRDAISDIPGIGHRMIGLVAVISSHGGVL